MLDDRLSNDPSFKSAFYDLGRSNRDVARKFDVNESVIRRGRARYLTMPGAEGQSLRFADETFIADHGVDMTPREAVKVFSGDSESELNRMLANYIFRPEMKAVTHQQKIFVTPIGDMQAGKIDGGGTPALIDRFARVVEQMRNRLAAAGGCELLIIPVLGDCIEGYVYQNGRNVTRLDLSISEQVRLYRRLLMHMVATLGVYAKEVVVVVLPGNHDETYRITVTPVTDSWAIEGASAVQDALAMSPDFGHVKFVYPQEEELVVTLDVGSALKSFIMGFTHGHLVTSPNKVGDWWGGQAFGRQHGGKADLLISGHFHFFRAEQMPGNRTWIQIPAFDGGSDWHRRETGAKSDPGALSLWVTPHQGIGWEGLTFHKG